MSTTGAAMRYERIARINTGTALSPTWTLMGEGFSSLDEDLAPNVDETTYISDTSATKTIQSYAPTWAYEGDVIKDDAAVTKLRAIGESLATGADAEVEVVQYDLWSADESGVCEAKKWTMTVEASSGNSGAGGEKLGFSGTLHGKGDPIDGTYNTGTNAFTASVS